MRRGFSLIEVIVAIGIVGILLIVLQATLRLLPLIHSAKDQDLALTIATNKIEDLRAGGYASLPATGSFSDPLLSSLPSGSGTLTATDANAKTKQLVVTVSWLEAGSSATSTIALTTLITQTGGLP